MENRNENYIKRGHVIEIQIRDEYFVSALIYPINKEKTEFRCELSLRDAEAGSSEEIGKTIDIKSTYKTVNSEVKKVLNGMINQGYFNEVVNNMENLYQCTRALLELKNRLIENC